MADPPSSFDRWRDYFRSINTDIFNIIEHAIMVASKDYPYDFRLKRDRIAEVLFACKVTKCAGCEKIELAVPHNGGDHDDDGDRDDDGVTADEFYKKKNGDGVEAVETKDSNTTIRNDDGLLCSYGDAEALTDEIEEESMFFDEVLRIKEVIDKSENMSDEELFDSLRRLELMPLSVEVLKATEIGKSVNCLRKHRLKEIRNLAKTLIADWKVMVDEWVNTTEAITEGETGSAGKTPDGEEEDEEGLPSPPLDEGAFFATPNSMELSQFFDGMDDDLNFDISEDFEKNQESAKNPAPLKKPEIRNRKLESPDNNQFVRPKDRKHHPQVSQRNNQEAALKKQVTPSKPNKPQNNVRPKPPSGEPTKVKNEIKVQQRSENTAVLKKPMPSQREKLNYDNEASVQMRLEVAKRKLHERYQEAEKAKKQRTVQVVELRDLPKQSLGQKSNQQHVRNGGHNNRHRANGRR